MTGKRVVFLSIKNLCLFSKSHFTTPYSQPPKAAILILCHAAFTPSCCISSPFFSRLILNLYDFNRLFSFQNTPICGIQNQNMLLCLYAFSFQYYYDCIAFTKHIFWPEISYSYSHILYFHFLFHLHFTAFGRRQSHLHIFFIPTGLPIDVQMFPF